MSFRSNQYFNDPGFAQAASNLALLFAPPTGADAAAWATANGKNAEAKRLADYFAYAKAPGFDQQTFDRMGVGAGVFTPTQSYYAVDQGNATSRANNAADNVRALDQTRMQQQGETARALLAPVAEGGTRFIPPGIGELYGLPAMQTGVVSAQPGEINTLPDGRVIAGTPKPLTESEWTAGQNERLRQSGQLSDQMLLDAIMGDKAPVQAVGVNGPVFMSPGAAVRTGATPYEKPASSSLEGDNYLAVGADGKELRFVGRPDAQGRVIDVNSGQVVPNVLRKEGTGGGMSLEVGKDGTVRMITGNGAGLTNARVTDLQRQEAEAGRATAELTSLFDTLRPDDLGAAGNVNELLTNYGAQMFPSLARPDVSATRSQLQATTLGLARTLMQDERLSDADRRAANEVMVSGGLGESLPGAQAKLASLIALSAYRQKYASTVRTGGERLAPLDANMLAKLVDEQAISPRIAQVYAQNVLSRGPQASNSPLPGVNIPRAIPPMAGQAEIPVVRTPEEAAALPPGTRFRTPDGREKVRP